MGARLHLQTISRPPLRRWKRAPSGLFVAWSAHADTLAESDALEIHAFTPFGPTHKYRLTFPSHAPNLYPVMRGCYILSNLLY